jgi:putative transposase
MILDDADFAAHVDYCHINPVKHGLARQTADWPYSTFHHYVKRGIIPIDWATYLAFDKVDGERP